jgi:hypothetical protein
VEADMRETNWQKWEASFINAEGRNNITFCPHKKQP